MQTVKNFFVDLGFDFNNHLLKPSGNFLSDNPSLKRNIETDIFFYQSPPQTNTSFYLITKELTSEELEAVRRYIWNETKADLIFFPVKSSNPDTLFRDHLVINLYYAKSSPKENIENHKIDSFKGGEEDLPKIDNISKWQFESGAFWLSYQEFVKKIKQSKSIDKILINALHSLKKKLYGEIKDDEAVQALIDRTLYIKYLEDNHIINSYFYNYYFAKKNLSYKTLLAEYKIDDLNKLFKIIHEIFKNSLFDKPKIDSRYLTKNVCDLLYHSISGTDFKNKQLRLFDFNFNVIPVEFISYIYEIFLSEKQKTGGIYYTPKKLAQLIIDDVMSQNRIGKVLDPSCGSGMFLIVAYQKILENSAVKKIDDIKQQIEHRIELLSNYIYGIEKEATAQRFTIFSLSLQIFRDLDPLLIKEYIAEQLDKEGKVDLFGQFSFFENIVCANSLSQKNKAFEGIAFDYIVGNPPFFEIKQTDEEITFLDNHEIEVQGKKRKAHEIIGTHQISQCFLIKIKDWSKDTTRFGFVSNSSNFYNEYSKPFQDYFYGNYKIEKIYELSKVKKILFENAKESVVALIFSNGLVNNNFLEYYPVEMGLFSEKPFELLIIQEDKILKLDQESIVSGEVKLRDFLTGNTFDKLLFEKLSSNLILEQYILTDKNEKSFVHRGLEIWGEDARKKEYNISEPDWKELPKETQDILLERFINRYFRYESSPEYNKGYLSPDNLQPFFITKSNQFINTIQNFHRPRPAEVYTGKKLILTRLGDKFKCVYTENEVYFNFTIYTVKLKDEGQYYLICAILNSQLCDFYVNQYVRKRVFDSYPRVGIEDLRKIPIPKIVDEGLRLEISNMCKDLTEGKYLYEGQISDKLNELVFDLYDLSYLEKQRIRDYFKVRSKVSNNELEFYKSILKDTIGIYFKKNIEVEFGKSDFNQKIAKVFFSKELFQNPNAEKVSKYILKEIFQQNPTENFLALREKIYGKDCLYIIRKDDNIYWTATKAFEDGKEILKQIL